MEIPCFFENREFIGRNREISSFEQYGTRPEWSDFSSGRNGIMQERVYSFIWKQPFMGIIRELIFILTYYYNSVII
jgi:hypothetical protein